MTGVLGHCLEHVYHIDKESPKRLEASPLHLENHLTLWEDSLDEHIRRLVIRGTDLRGSGAANLRLAYLSVKLLICRIQLDFDRHSSHISDVDSVYYTQARRVAEEVVDFVRELDEAHCRDFWLPMNAYTLTSATTFLVRCALTSRGLPNNPSLRLARAMIDTLGELRRKYAWDIGDNCFNNCSDLIEKIEAAFRQPSSATFEFDLEDQILMDMDLTALNDFFSEYSGSFDQSASM